MSGKVERKAGTGWPCTEGGFYCTGDMKPFKGLTGDWVIVLVVLPVLSNTVAKSHM